MTNPARQLSTWATAVATVGQLASLSCSLSVRRFQDAGSDGAVFSSVSLIVIADAKNDLPSECVLTIRHAERNQTDEREIKLAFDYPGEWAVKHPGSGST